MTDGDFPRSRWKAVYWAASDAAAPSRLGSYPAGEASPTDLAEALAHTLRNVPQYRVGMQVGEAFMGEGPEHPAHTIVRALFKDEERLGEEPAHFDDPEFRETAYALGQRLVREYAPEPPRLQPDTEGSQNG